MILTLIVRSLWSSCWGQWIMRGLSAAFAPRVGSTKRRSLTLSPKIGRSEFGKLQRLTEGFDCMFLASNSLGLLRLGSGGEGGIRTHGTRKGSTVFETARFNHS